MAEAATLASPVWWKITIYMTWRPSCKRIGHGFGAFSMARKKKRKYYIRISRGCCVPVARKKKHISSMIFKLVDFHGPFGARISSLVDDMSDHYSHPTIPSLIIQGGVTRCYDSGPAQTTASPCDESPISPGTAWSTDYTSGVSSTYDSSVNLLSPVANINHYLHQSTCRVFPQSDGTDVPGPYGFGSVNSHDISLGSVNHDSDLAYSGGLNLDDDHIDTLEEPLDANTRPNNTDGPFINPDSTLIAQLQCTKLSDDEHHIALGSEPGEAHVGQINAHRTPTGYPQHIDIESLSQNSPAETDGVQLQAMENMADGRTNPHDLINLGTINPPYHLCINTPGEGIFSCSLTKCLAPGSYFSTLEQICRHIDEEIKSRPFMCSSCKERFRNKADGDRHVTSKNEPNKYACASCKKGFGRKDALKAHVLNKHNTAVHQTNEDDCLDDNTQKKPKVRAKKSKGNSNYPYPRL